MGTQEEMYLPTLPRLGTEEYLEVLQDQHQHQIMDLLEQCPRSPSIWCRIFKDYHHHSQQSKCPPNQMSQDDLVYLLA
jgi:hypothetical protein